MNKELEKLLMQFGEDLAEFELGPDERFQLQNFMAELRELIGVNSPAGTNEGRAGFSARRTLTKGERAK